MKKGLQIWDLSARILPWLKKALKVSDWENQKLHVSEYSFSLSNRNVVNDSCIKGAFLVSDMISQEEKADLSGHWLFSDIYADARDTGTVLFGGCGLLSKMVYLNRRIMPLSFLISFTVRFF